MPRQNITDIILIFSENTSDCFCLLITDSPAWLRCWARSRGRCLGHTAPLSRRAAWRASPRHGPASPGQGASPLTQTSDHRCQESENLKSKYKCKVNGNMWWGKCWAWTWTWGENYAKHLKVQRDDGREKLHIFAEARSRKGLFTSQQSLF